MTELIWEGKYVDGKKMAPVRIALPFQTIETVNESAQDRERTLELFATGRDPDWRNRLIWGDKKYVLPSLLPEFAGKVNLIYIDPPFDTGADFSFTATMPDHPDTEDDEIGSFVKEPSILEQKAYRDTWGRGLDSYFEWFHHTIMLLRELLAENGSIKLPEPFGFAIEYTDQNMNLRCYYPDFVAIDQTGRRWIIETKGQETAEVARKDEAAGRWCEDASGLTGAAWRYLKVPQKEFEQLRPATLADLIAVQG